MILLQGRNGHLKPLQSLTGKRKLYSSTDTLHRKKSPVAFAPGLSSIDYKILVFKLGA